MAFITRLSRLMRADLHAVLDRIEEPELLLRQAVREMEDDLARADGRIQRLIRESEQLAAKEAEIGESLAGIGEELDLCFESDKDDLARVLIKRRLEAERVLKLINRRRQQAEKDLATEQTRRDENRIRFESMRQKAELLAEEAAFTPGDEFSGDLGGTDSGIRDDEVEVAFLREKKRREGK